MGEAWHITTNIDIGAKEWKFSEIWPRNLKFIQCGDEISDEENRKMIQM